MINSKPLRPMLIMSRSFTPSLSDTLDIDSPYVNYMIIV